MQKLLAGYQRFRANGWPGKRLEFETLADQGQAPEHLVITCIDSRLDPMMIFDAGPGEMLTVRNVASLVPPYEPDAAYHGTSAAIEFGVRVLEVRNLIVLGHGLCGGVKSLLEGTPANANEFIGPWMSMAEPARTRALRFPPGEGRRLICEHEVIKVSLDNLMTFPWVASRVAEGKLTLHGAWFDIRIGALMLLQADGTFAPYELAVGE
jgi:carbonic anhydrase